METINVEEAIRLHRPTIGCWKLGKAALDFCNCEVLQIFTHDAKNHQKIVKKGTQGFARGHCVQRVPTLQGDHFRSATILHSRRELKDTPGLWRLYQKKRLTTMR